MALNKFFRFPWAVSGTKTAVPDAIQSDGQVSYSEGYGLKYSKSLLNDPDARAVERLKWNQLLFEITTALREYQTNGIPDFITAAQNGGSNFSYPINAVVRYTDNNIYQSLIATNTDLPTVGTSWVQTSGLISGARLQDGTIPLTKLSAIAANSVPTNATAASAVPSALAMGLSTVFARLATGNIIAATITQIIDLVAGTAARGDMLYRGATAWLRLPAGSLGYVLTQGSLDPTWSAPIAGTFPALLVRNEFASGTGGGNASAGPNNRLLNTVKYNTITGASVNTSTGQVTLPAGTYDITGWGVAYRVDTHRVRLYNITTATYVTPDGDGSGEFSANPGIYGSSTSELDCRVTIASSTVFQLVTYCQTAGAVAGVGLGVNGAPAGCVEVFAGFKAVKIA